VEDAPDENTLPSRFRVTVLEISRVVPAEFTDEIVRQYSEGALKTVDEMRADIEKFIEHQSADVSRAEMERQVIEQISEAQTFEVPGSMVQRIMQSMLDNVRRRLDQPGLEKITVDDVAEEFRPRALEIARWQILSDKIAEIEGVDIEDKDIDPYVEHLKLKSPKLNETQVRNFVLQQEGLISEIFQRKTFDKLFEYAIITEVPSDEYFAEENVPFHPDDNVRRYFGTQPDDSIILP
jgi:trigger factor